MALMIGIAAAEGKQNNKEKLIANWTGTQIESKAWDFHNPASGPQWYQIRYYQPGTFNSNNTEIGMHNSTNPNGYFNSSPFVGNASYNESNPYIDHFTPSKQDEWDVVLMKAGTATSSPEVIDSLRINVPVLVSIPEFPTIAMPIAAVLLMIFIMHRRKKEE